MDRPPRKKKPLRDGRAPARKRPPAPPKRRAPDGLTLRRIGGNDFAFFPPNLAVERQEDLEEVHAMIAAGELEIARDELLYLVADCRDFLAAHNLLGDLAIEEEDVKLARGHFGFAYETALEAIPPGFKGRIPAGREYSGEFFAAGCGLARCLVAQGQVAAGRELLAELARFDPKNVVVQALCDELDHPAPCAAEPALVTLQVPAKPNRRGSP